MRFSILDWAPTFLTQAKGVELKAAGWATASYEIFGAFGIILSGFMMDKLFKGRGAKACFYYMLGCAGAAFLFWKFNSSNLVLNALLMSLIGFFIYGPQCLIGCVASTVATKKLHRKFGLFVISGSRTRPRRSATLSAPPETATQTRRERQASSGNASRSAVSNGCGGKRKESVNTG